MALSFRAAKAIDLDAMRDVFGRDPSEEQLGLAGGDADRARRFRALMASQLFSPAALEHTTVAIDDDGEVVGLVQEGAEAGLSVPLILGVLRIFRFDVLAFVRRDRSRSQVHLPIPPGAYHLAEIHVLASRRNRGIGEALLAEAERDARSRGFAKMSLTTTTSNPARHLYERFGFDLVETREDASYLAATGIAGRILMVKMLA